MGYLAKEFLNGFSAKAAKMYVALLAFMIFAAPRNLKPFEVMSKIAVLAVASASDKFG
jgi:hypothetical protein